MTLRQDVEKRGLAPERSRKSRLCANKIEARSDEGACPPFSTRRKWLVRSYDVGLCWFTRAKADTVRSLVNEAHSKLLTASKTRHECRA